MGFAFLILADYVDRETRPSGLHSSLFIFPILSCTFITARFAC